MQYLNELKMAEQPLQKTGSPVIMGTSSASEPRPTVSTFVSTFLALGVRPNCG
jgi:hypothetical protein